MSVWRMSVLERAGGGDGGGMIFVEKVHKAFAY